MALYYFLVFSKSMDGNCPVLPHRSCVCLNVLSIHQTRLVFPAFCQGNSVQGNSYLLRSIKTGWSMRWKLWKRKPPPPQPVSCPASLQLSQPMLRWFLPTAHATEKKNLQPPNTTARLPFLMVTNGENALASQTAVACHVKPELTNERRGKQIMSPG